MKRNYNIMWVDDEIDNLKPHLLFLESHGYKVTPVVSGLDAVEMLKENNSGWDVVMLDENMPGLSGMETLEKIRDINNSVPVVMITKSEEEDLIDNAVASRINDYLIKPVNPRQILHSLRKLLDGSHLVNRKTTENYHKDYMTLSLMIGDADSFEKWVHVYRALTQRAIDYQSTGADVMHLLDMQHDEAQKEFSSFIKRNYASWFFNEEQAEVPLLSHRVLERLLLPELREVGRAVLIVFDNFRLDQWLTVKDDLLRDFIVADTRYYCSLLPTVTQYARNALLSGLLPSEIASKNSPMWITDDDSEESKNAGEEVLLRKMLDGKGFKDTALNYYKANTSPELKKIVAELSTITDDTKPRLIVVVINFLDIMSHSKTDSVMMRELAGNDSALRSITHSWFRNSPVATLLRAIAALHCSLFLTTDHGSVLVKNALGISGDKSTTTALRFKEGRNMGYPPKEVMAVTKPESIGLPSRNISSCYIFALESDYFIYPNDFNRYASMFRDTYQHGGVSMEEMIVPWIKLKVR